MRSRAVAVGLAIAVAAVVVVVVVDRMASRRSAAVAAAGAAAAAERDAGSALFHGTASLPGRLAGDAELPGRLAANAELPGRLAANAELPGRLAGHAEVLPSVATRCSNCHEANNRAPSGSASDLASRTTAPRSYAGRLDSGWLTQLQSRRGGPPSRYDPVSLCTLLRTGTDAASVIVPTVMPRYAATDAQCRALWAYLVTPK